MKSLHRSRVCWLQLSGCLVALIGLCATALAEDQAPLTLVARDPAGHGMLCRSGEKTILMVSGTPEQMGAAHGTLLHDQIQAMMGKTAAVLGKRLKIADGQKFLFHLTDKIAKHGGPYVPPRFFAECDAMSKAAGITRQQGRAANLFQEQFHCSGVAVHGKATIGGRVLHARVLDYICDAGFQKCAAVIVYMPAQGNAWMSLGYAGFIGTVTAMNEKGLAVGEKGNGAAGPANWNGMPMTFLLRDVMERASNVEEALDIIRKTPRTCDYSYVLSDKSGEIRSLRCTPKEMIVLKPGQQHPKWGAPVPPDTVFISMHPKEISQRLFAEHGKIDVPRMIEILKRPVASKSNLHDAIFAPQTLDMWFADAGRKTCACDEPYAHVNLKQLIEYYRK